MLQIALPVIVAELGWITMGIVDTIIVGPLGPAAIGAVGSGSTMFLAVMVLGMGTLLALDTFVAQNYGAGRIDECHRWLFAGLQLAGVIQVVQAREEQRLAPGERAEHRVLDALVRRRGGIGRPDRAE